MKFLPVGAELFYAGEMTDTDRQTNLIATFRNIANWPKNYCMLSKKILKKLTHVPRSIAVVYFIYKYIEENTSSRCNPKSLLFRNIHSSLTRGRITG